MYWLKLSQKSIYILQICTKCFITLVNLLNLCFLSINKNMYSNFSQNTLFYKGLLDKTVLKYNYKNNYLNVLNKILRHYIKSTKNT